MKTILALAVAFAALACAHALGSDKCTWGPSYWCSDMNAANTCGALAYCQSKGFLLEDNKVSTAKPVASPGECKLCLLAINGLDGKLTKNSTVQEIEAALDGACSNFGAFKAPCETLVKKYTPELISVLINDVNATRVCQKVHLCPATVNLPAAVTDTLTFASNIASNVNVPANTNTATDSKAVLGANPCTDGPAYWCSTLLAAQKCKAESFCKTGPWAKTGVPSA
eukprot:m.220372 g.220372  ORF g.220372 m.220372 type:complete len:226 (-) comp10367_c0_seq1:50-727(-)